VTALALGHKERQEQEAAAEAEFSQFMSNLTAAVEAAERPVSAPTPAPAAPPPMIVRAAPPKPAPAKPPVPRPADPSPAPTATSTPVPAPPDNRPPVTVEVLRVAPADAGVLGTLQLRAQNRTDAPVQELKLRLDYLDESGRPLKQYRTVHGGDPVVVGPEASAEFDLPAFEMPRLTRKATARVDAVVFADGRRWPAER
ncbi:MAG TPA: hypothetical protein PKE47_02065, partial [Verrucomicrobiota bacterium]|nr:hypothetical protein [Verrucomicrobiota bacterium]